MLTHNVPDLINVSKQSLFDAVARALMAQDGPAIGPDGKAAYRAPDGRRCAIGHLIPDHLYRPEIEGKVASIAVRMIGLARTAQPPHTMIADTRPRAAFLDALQQVHDRLPFAACQRDPQTYRSMLAARLTEFAAQHGLSDAVVYKA